ncbi:MAG: DUF3644 domain-containing protein [candidate division Zixibacteria bacterium]|nr:DUF3644 domain-containing protein [candidate division Zixibacteria bacterium]
MTKRIRRFGSLKNELISKSREAVLAAVQIFNNPNISFKAESYIVLMIIGWTYLLHAYYREKGVEHRYFKQRGQRRRFDRTKKGAFKYWELEQCLREKLSPIDKDTSNNLRFLIGLRHEIEHQMTTRIDDLLSARFQACCLNFNTYIQKLFGEELGIDKHLSFSLQFSTIESEQKDMLADHPELPANIQGYIKDFDQALTEKEYDNQRYAYRILFVPKTANRVGQADRVIEFVKSDSPLAENLNIEYAMIRETERKKYLPKQIVKIMKSEGYKRFTIHKHTILWKSMDAKKNHKGFGTIVTGTHWCWYETWVEEVRKHCSENARDYK